MTGPTRIVPVVPTAERREPAKTWRGRTRLISGDAAWGAATSAILILVAGALTLATGQPFLFAALGPTAVLIASAPGHPSSRFHSVVVGHLSALLCAWLVVILVGASSSNGMSTDVGVARVWASAMAVAVTALLQPSLRAYHPPSAATTLLITLGAYQLTWKSSASMMGGVVIVALMGEWFQRIRLRDEPVRQ
ncbi:MAG: HPP family protein [Gemmatimonadaceae bacterium]